MMPYYKNLQELLPDLSRGCVEDGSSGGCAGLTAAVTENSAPRQAGSRGLQAGFSGGMLALSGIPPVHPRRQP